MRPSRFGWCVLLLACEGEDIRLGSGRPTSGGPAGPPAFGEPVAIAALYDDANGDDDPSLTADLTEMLFNSQRAGGLGKEDIWLSRRPSPNDPWGSAQHVQALNSEARETGIALSQEGLWLLFSSDREGGLGGLDVYRAERPSRDDPWSAPTHVPELSTSGDDLVSALSSDELALYLARRADDEEDYDLFVARRATPITPFSSSEPLSALNSSREESDAFPWRADVLFFTRDEQLQVALLDASRVLLDGPRPVSGLNSEQDDRDLWVAADGRYAVFSSDREGEYRLYEARAP